MMEKSPPSLHLRAIILQIILLFPSLHSKPQHITRTNILTDFNNSIHLGGPISHTYGDDYFTIGSHMLNAWNLFIEWTNLEQHEILLNDGKNYSFSLTYIEDYSEVPSTQIACNYLVHDYPVDILLGPYSSLLTHTCSEVTNQTNKLMMASGSTYPDSNPLAFYTLPSDESRLAMTFRTFLSYGVHNISVIRDADASACLFVDVLSAAAKEKIDLYQYYELDPMSSSYLTDLEAIIIDLRDNHVEAVLSCSLRDLCLHVPSISRSLNYNPAAMSFVICLTDENVIHELGDLSDYLFDSTFWAPLESIKCEITGWTAAEFYSIYLSKFGMYPTYHAASAFAGCLVLYDAIKSTQSLDPYLLSQMIQSPGRVFRTMYANLSFVNSTQADFSSLIKQVHSLTYLFLTCLKLRYSHTDFTYSTTVVAPTELAQGTAVFPMPTWTVKSCNSRTLYCNGHGTCSSLGICECVENYYGYKDPISCDTYCDGDMVEGLCRENLIAYIGGLLPYSISGLKEYIAAMNLAVLMVNNKTDGWFDQTPQITFVIRINDSNCDANTAFNAILDQEKWASTNNDGKQLHGVIGAYCSEARFVFLY